jgi:hypothetical protein
MRSTPWKVVAIAGALLCAPATAAAAERPVATTGAAANIQPSTVVLNGTVNPKGAATQYFFQYGTTSLYGLVTPATAAGGGNKGVKVAVAVGGLAPATTYHYRLVAQNSKGIARGRHRTFKTRPQPLGVTLAATPNPVTTGGSTTLSGVLSGTNNDGRQVVVKSNPFPYTQGFLPVGNPLLTLADGSFSMTLPTVAVNTQFIVQMPAKPEVVSPVVVLGTTVKVARWLHVRRGERRGRLRFRGRITPAVDGRQILIQKLRRSDGVWYTVGKTVANHAGGTFSRYRKWIRQRKGGRYRVLVNMDDVHSASSSRSIKVRRVRD